MADKNKVKQIKLSNGEQYEIDAKYWGGYETSDVKTINGESIFGEGDITLPSALKYCGITTTKLEDGSTVNPVIIDGNEHLASTGCVVFYEDKEFVFNANSKWELFGAEATYKVVQSPVSAPNVSGDATAFIDSISQDINGVITVTKKNVDMPIVKGDAENSAVLKGEYEGYSNKAISQTSMAIGAATTAGLKGWYYSAIDFTNNIITLSDKQPYALLGNLVGGSWKSGTPNIAVGDKVSIVNNAKYDYCGEVKSISGNKITLKSALSFNKLDIGTITANNPDDWSIYLPEKESAGIIDFGGGAFAEGVNTKATNIGSHAEGIQTHAYGQFSHTEGFKTEAGYAAHAEGRETEAIGTMSHAEGQSTLAIGSKSHAEGTQTETHANNSHAEGYKSVVKDGAGAHVEGYGSVIDFTESTKSSDIPSDANKEQSIGAHVEGVNNTGAGIAVHVEGKNNKANRTASHAEGVNTRAGVFEVPNENTTSTEGLFTHAEGNSTLARGSASHAEGAGTQALARAAHAEGRHSIAAGNYSHAEGFDTFAGNNEGELLSTVDNNTIGYFTHAEGHNTLAQGNSSHAEGKQTKAVGIVSHAEGKKTIAEGEYSHSEGYSSHAKGYSSHAEGQSTNAEGNNSHAEGFISNAIGGCSHAEGSFTYANGEDSHAEGYSTVASGYVSHAEGYQTRSDGIGSHAEGLQTITNNEAEHASGKYNKSTKSPDTSQATHFSIGIGTSDTKRKNAFEVKQNGDIYIEGVEGRIQDKLNEISEINKTIEDNEEVVAAALNKLNDELKNISVNASQSLVNITYSELVNLRDNGELIPGQQYRITDYTTTTVQENTRSAGHQFDIIVTADDVNVLNENARAIQHTISEYDYFYHSNLNAWELWYSLDNDTSRFYWADVDSGKGVIYRMIDEWKNDIPYDFKNIQFKRWKVDTNVEGADTSGFDKYIGFKSGVIGIHDVMQDLFIVDDNDYVWSYTLQIYSSDGLIGDASNCIGTSNYVECKYNTILSYSIDEIRYLNNVVIFGSYTSGNQCVKGNLFETDCHSMTIGSDNSEVWENKFGQFCKGNVICADAICQNKFGQNMTSVAIIPASSTSHVASNTFNGNYFQYNFINGVFYYNTIGDAFKNNTILSAFQQNNIGDMFQENILSKKFVLNNIGVQCKDNKFNDEFKGNTVDNGMNGNIFNGECTYTSFGKVFEKNVLNYRLNLCEIGYGAVDNTFGDVINSRFGALFQNNEIVKCKACDFGVGFRFNKFTDVFEGKNIGVSCSRFGDYVWYNNFNTDVVFNDDNTSVIQNLNVQSNLQGTKSSYLNIVVPVDSNAEIKVAKNTNGEVKVYCEADLIA